MDFNLNFNSKNDRRDDKVASDNDKNVFDKISIISSNCRGLTSKRSSVEQGLDSLWPDVALYQETFLKGKRVPRFRGYTTVNRNRTDCGGGGVMTLTHNRLATRTCVASLGDDNCEYIVTRLDLLNPAICIINHYGPQEKSTEDTSDAWDRILVEIAKARARQDQVLLFGDLNRHLGGRAGAPDKLTYGGKLVNQLLDGGEFSLVNTLPVATGGPYTRQCPNNPDNKSILTLAIVSNDLIPFIEKFHIDSERKYTPRRVMKRKTGPVSVFSDHYVVELVLTNLPNIPRKKRTHGWFYQKPGGWCRYFNQTKEAAPKIMKLIEDFENEDVNLLDNRIQQCIDRIKWKCFGKTVTGVTGGNFYAGTRAALSEDHLTQADLQTFQDALSRMREKGSRMGQVWELKKLMHGGKAEQQIPAAVVDPDTGELQLTVEGIKNATVRHIINTLKDGKPIEKWKHVVKERDEKHNKLMKEEPNVRISIPRQAFKNVVQKMKRSNKAGYKEIIMSSPEILDAYFEFYKLLAEHEVVPDSFSHTTLTQLYKKADPSDLNNWRFIHCKQGHVRLFEGCLTEICKPMILSSVSPQQIGGISGNRPEQHLLSMKTILRSRELRQLPTWVSLFDLRKFFDLQSAKDACEALHQAGVQGPLYRLIYKICATNILVAKTPVGITKPFKVPAIVAQGSSLGALQSALNLDRAISKAFLSVLNITMSELGVPATPYCFQDDISKLSATRSECQISHDVIFDTLSSKTLELNHKKCKLIICGKNHRSETERAVYEDYPVTTGPHPTSLAENDAYLGDEIHMRGTRASWMCTVEKRKGKLRAAMAESVALAQDFRANTIGPLAAALDLWSAVCLPAFLHNSSSWIHITQTDYKQIEKFQTQYLRKAFAAPRFTSSAALRWDAGLLTLRHRIMLGKVLLRDHLMHAEVSCLARVLYEASDRDSPGFKKEVEDYMEEYRILSRKVDQTKEAYKRYVKNKVYSAQRLETSKELFAMSRTKFISGEEFGRKKYIKDFTLRAARFVFCARAGVLDVLKGNNYSIPSTERLCQCGKEIESAVHLSTDCPLYRNTTAGFTNKYSDPVQVYEVWRLILDKRYRLIAASLAGGGGAGQPGRAPSPPLPPPPPAPD